MLYYLTLRVQLQQVMPKVKYFMWRTSWLILPTANNLIARGCNVSQRCCIFGLQNETVYHVFFECAFSLNVWSSICTWVTDGIEEWAIYRGFFGKKILLKWMNRNFYVLHCGYYGIIERNKGFHDNVISIPWLVADKAKSLVASFKVLSEQAKWDGDLGTCHVWVGHVPSCSLVLMKCVFLHTAKKNNNNNSLYKT